MDHRAVLPQKNQLLDQAPDPEKAHPAQKEMAQSSCEQVVRNEEASRSNHEKDVDQAEIGDLENRTIRDATVPEIVGSEHIRNAGRRHIRIELLLKNVFFQTVDPHVVEPQRQVFRDGI